MSQNRASDNKLVTLNTINEEVQDIRDELATNVHGQKKLCWMNERYARM